MSLYVGDVRDGLRKFIADGVRAQTCVTSPPYWGLRDYGTCRCGSGRFDLGQGENTGGNMNYRPAQKFDPACKQCSGTGRVLGTDRQLGLEPTIAEYVAAMVDVFRLVRDVLADDGTLWLNLGDSYAQSSGTGGTKSFQAVGPMIPGYTRKPSDGLKPKDLCGIPWRVAFALQADGWYLRSDIIWHKPNPMPESVTDRPTKAHEYLFLLAKSERYYYDAAAIAEAGIGTWNSAKSTLAANGVKNIHLNQTGQRRTAGADTFHRDEDREGRNRRTVWTITTEPYADAHFAVMPTALVEPCIAAGSRVGDIVLDPFMGSGTVAQVAQDLGRRWIGCELNPDYAKMIEQRTAQGALALAAD